MLGINLILRLLINDCLSYKTNILFCVEIGDASIDKAAKNAGITKITHIDVHQKSIFIFWSKTTVNVYGE